MCQYSSKRNPFHCIVPPFMVAKIIAAAPEVRGLAASAIRTRFNDQLFRKKRILLSEMAGEEMKTVLSATSDKLMALAKPAATRKVAAKKAAPSKRPNRHIYDAQNSNDQRDLPGKLVRKEGQRATTDKDANNIYNNCGHTWDFFYNSFRRDSIDGRGLPLVNTVHFGTNFGNAFWEGSQMVYGDGDAVFKSFTADIDITAHELTHGVVQYEADLVYEMESGAINESMADIFGILVRQVALNETATTSDWLIGRTTMRVKNAALRSLKAPGTAYRNHPILGDDPQPAHMNHFVNLPNTEEGDWGGVHINSGIPNHAFYLAAIAIGGQPWLKVGKIWYEALCDRALLHRTSSFLDLANATIIKAGTLFGAGSIEEKSVVAAWKGVGL